jgi:hypothetical protein
VAESLLQSLEAVSDFQAQWAIYQSSRSLSPNHTIFSSRILKTSSIHFNPDTFYHPNPSHHGTTDFKESFFLEEDHRQFNAGFFNIKPGRSACD